jgi:hypothetical protein
MSTPTNQQDIMGGMGAPTEYANGVSGYSSQPMFQQSVDRLQAERPGQFDHMNSFFIDPFTGKAGSNVNAPVNYENYATSAQNSRNQAAAQRANDLEIAYAQAGAGPESVYNLTGGNTALSGYNLSSQNPTSTDPYGDYSTDYTGGNPELSEYELGNHYPTSTDPYGDYSQVTPDNFVGIADRFDGGGAGRSGDTYSGGGVASDLGNSLTTSVDLPGNVVSRTLGVGAGAKSDTTDSGFVGADGGGEGGDGTVICTSMHTLGLISDDVYKLDAEFGEIINEADPSLLAGYRLWATPVADYILGDSLGSKLALSVVTPLATSWAAQMAHVMRPEKYKPNRLGKIVMFVGHPICRLAGYMSSGGGNLIKKGA